MTGSCIAPDGTRAVPSGPDVAGYRGPMGTNVLAAVHSFALESADLTSSPIAWVFSVIFSILLIYCAYKSAAGGHWILFFLGFCFPLLWIIGAVIAPRDRLA